MKIKKAIVSVCFLVFCGNSYAQCTKDIECKGSRVCDRGVCVSLDAQVPLGRSAIPTESPKPRIESVEPKFSDYPVTKFSGPFIAAKNLKRVGPNEWRNENGRPVPAPTVNFAGKYHLVINSCGTSCRYYTLTDVSTGVSLEAVSVFTSAEPAPTTKEGYTYVTDLFGKADSRLLVAQYQVDLPKGGTECRERVFVFEAEKLKPVTNTRRGCSSQ